MTRRVNFEHIHLYGGGPAWEQAMATLIEHTDRLNALVARGEALIPKIEVLILKAENETSPEADAALERAEAVLATAETAINVALGG